MTNPIQEFAKERGIKALMHFTRLSNLTSILQRGLVMRDTLVLEDNNGALNDQYRHDHTNAICLTIGFPNYKMFWGLRRDNPGTDWVIVALSPSVLFELPCAFCVTNAAAARVSLIPIEQRMTIDAFRAMYADFDDKPRAQLGLTNDLPTNPQAEILVQADIPPQHIFGVSVLNAAMKAKVEGAHPGVTVRVHDHLFSGRSDHAYWK